ncbi:MlaE family ABC transporter permease [Hydrogenobaculum acidophilum]
MELTKETLEEKIDISAILKDHTIDIKDVDKIDTFGAIFVLELLETYKDKKLIGKKEHIEFIQKVKELLSYEADESKKAKSLKISLTFLEYIGALLYQMFSNAKDIELGSFLKEIENSGIGSLFILGVLSFLVGVVIAYQSASELISFGANIFIVNLIGISAFRELGPLITGIILAGRVSSGYTANIGIRNVYEELDALEVMGISPFVVFGLPRIITLSLITPVLVLFSSNLMVFGGAIIAKIYLDIPFNMFFDRLKETVGISQILIGVIKAPFFGAYIGLIGTYFGFYSGKKPEEVTSNVMKSVVISISGIIVIDAIFSIIFAKIGI